jgi:AcrR family transcriptional regulator
MVPAEPGARLGLTPRTSAQQRTMRTALDLFAAHGVSGTSYQMIADALGVTKAAVYHQFKTKRELILAVAETELARLEDAMEIADAADDSEQARTVLLASVIDHAVEHRAAAAILLFDPAIGAALSEHVPIQRFVERLYGTLVGAPVTPAAQVRLAMLAVAIGGTVGHPLVAELDDETLRSEMIRAASGFITTD